MSTPGQQKGGKEKKQKMPSKKQVIAIRPDEKTYKKIKIICEEENRPMANLGETLFKNYIKKYEQENGEIKID